MNAKRWNFNAILLGAIMFLALPSLAGADTYLVHVTFTDGMEMGGNKLPGKSDTANVWFGDGKMCVNPGEATTMITDAKKNMMYILNNADKSYHEISLDALGDAEKMLGAAASDSANQKQLQAIKGMAAMMTMSAKVTPTEETKKIKDYNCKKFDVVLNMGMASITMASWVTTDIDIDYATFWKVMQFQIAIMPGADQVFAELAKMGGITVLSDGNINAMGSTIKQTMELLEAGKKDAPAGTYDIPKDYKKVPFQLPQMGM